MFFSNLAPDNKMPYTIINGRKMCLSYKLFSEVFGVSSSGRTLYNPKDEVWDDYNKCNFYLSLARISPQKVHARRARIHSGHVPERDNWSAGILNIDDRLFHYFLVYVLFPRAGNHCTITDFEMQVMDAVKKGMRLNWGQLIGLHLSTFDRKSKYLPYAWFITRILEHFETNFSAYECFKMDKANHKVSIRNVDKHMDVVFDKESLTIKYLDVDSTAETHDNHEDPAEPVIPPPTRAPRSAAPSSRNAAMMEFMTQQFSNLQTSMNEQWTDARTQMTKYHEESTTHINIMEKEMHHNFDYLYTHLHIPPFDHANPAPPIPPVVSLQQMPPPNANNSSFNPTNMDLS